MSATLVFDAHLSSTTLIQGLRARGIDARAAAALGFGDGVPDLELVKGLDKYFEGSAWVLTTMDLTIIDDQSNFDWGRYAIAWIAVRPGRGGSDFEAMKHNIVHHRAMEIVAQTPGNHFTYTEKRRFKSMPSLISQLH